MFVTPNTGSTRITHARTHSKSIFSFGQTIKQTFLLTFLSFIPTWEQSETQKNVFDYSDRTCICSYTHLALFLLLCQLISLLVSFSAERSSHSPLHLITWLHNRCAMQRLASVLALWHEALVCITVASYPLHQVCKQRHRHRPLPHLCISKIVIEPFCFSTCAVSLSSFLLLFISSIFSHFLFHLCLFFCLASLTLLYSTCTVNNSKIIKIEINKLVKTKQQNKTSKRSL